MLEPSTIVLDAMGVVFRAGDDVAELLVPYVAAHGGAADAARVGAAYLRASRGELTGVEFWRSVGLDDSDVFSLNRMAGLVFFCAR